MEEDIMDNPGQCIRLGILDPEFSLVASQAAIELDNVIRGKTSYRLTSIKRVADFLKCSFEKNSGQAEKMTFDSSTLAVLGNAFDTMVEGYHAQTVIELVDNAWKVAEQLETSDKGSDKQILEQMREFCVVLASCVSSYRQSIEDMAPTHPYKRS
jgi:hypothetical protein